MYDFHRNTGGVYLNHFDGLAKTLIIDVDTDHRIGSKVFCSVFQIFEGALSCF